MDAIGTLLYMCCRSLTFSSSTSSSGAADAAVDDNDDDVDIPPLREKYDVFISFRGEDTRKNFTSHLHAALRGKKIETYMDYRLERGDEIAPALREAIEKSRLSVIIFSKNYASSTWCLIELVHILKCKKKNGQMVVPIFYDISPSEVRKQEGSYAGAFAELENRFKDRMDKVIEWKAALVEATGLSGFDYSNKKGTEADFIKEVVEDISTKLKRETLCDLKGMVVIESRIEQVESLLSTNDWKGVCTVGIWGMGGIGKTTLAKAVFNRLSSKFEASCLLNNVREKAEQTDGVVQLQKTLLREILKEEDLSIDKKNVKERLGRTKVLIVFDDVSDWRQIKDLAGDYDNGSRIIVTSKDWGVLKKAVSDEKYIYEVQKIKTDDALRLFQLHAFKDNSPREEYTELSERVVQYAGGIPLALEVLGSLFFERESKHEWEEAWSTLRNYPNEEIQNTLRVSYNRLPRSAREVFLDIACFYKGERREHVEKMVDFGQGHGGSCAADGITVLRNRSLISIASEWGTIDMHDLVQEMGWSIVREQCIEEPGRRSRLFTNEDIYHVLKNNTGTEKVQAINCPLGSRIEEQNLDRADFKKMYNMRLLKTGFWRSVKTLFLPNSLRYLNWLGYHLKSLPPEFSAENLVELHMPFSKVTQLWDGGQNPMNLKVIDLSKGNCLTALPNLLGSPNIEHMDLSGCGSLVEIPQHFKNLDKLTRLNLSCCKSLEYLPEMPDNIVYMNLCGCESLVEIHQHFKNLDKLTCLNLSRCNSLEYLPEMPDNIEDMNLFGCGSLVEIPQHFKNLDKLTHLNLSWCRGLEYLPEMLDNIEDMDLSGCESLVEIHQHFKNLDKLTRLNLSQCKSLEYLPEMPDNIEFLNLRYTGIKELPSSVWSHERISSLDIAHCEKLKELPSNTCKLKVSGAFSLNGCTSLEKFWELPGGIGKLDLSHTRIEVLPTSSMRCLLCLTKLELWNSMNIASLLPRICELKSLEKLDLSRCSELEVVPSSIYELTNIKTLSFSHCRKLQKFCEPTGSVGFLSLEVLNLHGSGILEIPEGVICSTSLRVLDLELTKIQSIPLSIKQVSQLSRLCLSWCKSLRSLPELPMVRRLHADGCESLNTVLSSRTAITRCWNRYELLQEEHTFCDCPSLGYDARSSIMVDSQLRIMRVATASSKLKEEKEDFVCFSTASSNLKEEEEEERYFCSYKADRFCSYKEDHEKYSKKYSGPSVSIVCSGDKIPNWFLHQNEGASINVRLPANWFREGFLGFALSFVESRGVRSFMAFKCKYNFKTGEGESHEINCSFTIRFPDYIETQHVFVLYKDLEYEEKTKWSSAFYDRVAEVSVHFLSGSRYDRMVEKCGMCLLYAEDAEKLKCDVMSQQEQDERAASGSGDPEASGSNESEEASRSDDSEGESGAGDPEASGSNESEEASGRYDSEGESG
ncbi:disease resistance protein TAO1-like [Pyrus communis]|uniref:disease resistance protein TAO1-like n=1 Tax=Pyrus communis TaxID=23211 RepID=UPI0035BF30A8